MSFGMVYTVGPSSSAWYFVMQSPRWAERCVEMPVMTDMRPGAHLGTWV
eukprot:CAMPEP_0119493892 /NCGR_PEP_ID=MMETSP1344-20130328/18012_1 /TAXON_ID=236787 /ORGANISM="Florenciella parvula, Strain CCMP2471" /LENGTH=48 /DNA_ID= /DNA_START= /DNA_END= /DNA_ORIENTATION=